MDLQFEKIVEPGSFVLVCGNTGSGKTTLLKKWKKDLGDKAILVMQNPDNQIVMDTVYSEMAFGLSCLGMDSGYIKRRVAEIASFFSISHMFDKETDTLSGGEKQILNLASSLTMNPDVLLLDEPTSMLDPVMTIRLIERIKQINKEYLKTVVIVEHRPEELFDYADKVIYMDSGNIAASGNGNEVSAYMKENGATELLPAAARIFNDRTPMPLSLKEGRKLIGKKKGLIATSKTYEYVPIIKMKDVCFAYEKKNTMILDDFSMELYRGKVHVLVGENGSGKTTVARILTGKIKPYSGKIKKDNFNIAMLSQDVTDHFIKDNYNGKHPYDLSGGEQQLLALSLVIENNPDVLILDEPTKGLDGNEKIRLNNTINEITKTEKTILVITHDMEFAAEIADVVYMISKGMIVFKGSMQEFCKDNVFYTTPVFRMWKDVSESVLTVKDAKDWNQ